MATKYSTIPDGKIFEAKGGHFRKLDALYYEDIQTGFQAVWNPMFDEGINASSTAPVADSDNTKDKFLVDRQTRMVKPNPNYRECDGKAERVFAEMWGTAEFDCGPEDYDYIAMRSTLAVAAMNTLTKLLGLPNSPDKFADVVTLLSDCYTSSQNKPKAKKGKK